MTKKSCKRGYYYCYASKKCKKIPMGYVVGMGGWLRKEKEEEKSSDETEGKKKNGNGNGSNGNGNGNGGSDGGSDGGGVSEAWSSKYKKSIDCDNPKGFSQRAHCQGKKKVTEGKEGDHEVSMAKSQLKKSAENIAKLRKVLKKKTDKDNLPAWVQAKITDTEHNTDAAAGYMEEGKRDGKSAKSKGYSLRDWFKGGGWVQAGGKYDGKPCAKQPGQKTKPFCRDADDRANMSKKERSRRAAKKRREDPNPDRKGKAKMVTDNYSNWRNELQLDEGMGLGLAAGAAALAAAPYLAKKFLKPKVDKAIDKQRKTAPIGGDRRVPQTEGYSDDGDVIRSTDRIRMKDGKLRTLKDLDAKLKDKGTKKEEVELVDEGKKDACYHKVKSRYSVWPSAYASGALVKCRKVGAKNWGNKTKKEGFSDWREDMLLEGLEDKLRKMSPEQIEDLIKANKGAEQKIRDALKNLKTPKSQGPGVQLPNIPKQPASTSSVTPRETYQKGGSDRVSYQRKPRPAKPSTPKVKVKPRMRAGKIGLALTAAGAAAPFVINAIKKRMQPDIGVLKHMQKEGYEFSNWRDDFQATEYESIDIIKAEPLKPTEGLGSKMLDEKCWKGYEKKGMKTMFGKRYPNCVKKEEVEFQEDWQKSNRNDGVDGMSQKSVDAYKRENPGSKLQTAVTGKNPKGKDKKRRKSFCARSKGQKDMHNIDCSKTPDKKICKARKRWRC